MAAAAAAQPLPGPIASLFNECQKSLANHAKTSKALFELEKKAQKTFGAHFIAAVDRALIVPGREPAVEVRSPSRPTILIEISRDSSSSSFYTRVRQVAPCWSDSFDT